MLSASLNKTFPSFLVLLSSVLFNHVVTFRIELRLRHGGERTVEREKEAGCGTTPEGGERGRGWLTDRDTTQVGFVGHFCVWRGDGQV